ncbi:MAG TPA: UDP-N-acetylmuramoyl-tripeptide--D-alanyl-D-alanine ligase [Candidatus Saccharimonadales bacterium]|nr:UDP-N-acetylmuramoyl-tripeptide--D-alanyl-D-alanine ligase [Candidatus Saccharimonadales bacterium]
MKDFITRLLEFQAKRLLAKAKPQIVAVTGSVGKTSTKLNIATVLSQKYKVLAHYGSYNTHIAVPMAIFDMQLPLSLKNPVSWVKVLWDMEKKIKADYPYEVLVLELGTDHPGEIAYFSRYIKPDVAVVTAVSEEHMEYFGTIDAVAKEELAVTHFSREVLINRDDVDVVFAKLVPEGINLDTYGTSGVAEYRFTTDDFHPGEGFAGQFISPEFGEQKVELHVAGEHNARTVVAAGAVGIKMGLTAEQVVAGMNAVRPVTGRMNILKGLKQSTLIDDTYNSSPLAAIAALQTLYLFPTKQRIAILGSMNELGAYSPQAHQQVGSACDPGLLDWVITVGAEAEQYLAPAAAAKGCQVRSFTSPYEAGTFAHSILQTGAVVLAKGSQNRVFTEEALKVLLHTPGDEANLVRQSPFWLEIKAKQFGIPEVPRAD